MNQLIAVCVLVVMTTTVVDAECGLSRASKLTKERRFLPNIVDRDKRNFIEYHVTYRNFSNDLPAFNKTNTDRFQLFRWFNVNEEAIEELKMIYDSNFNLFRGMFDIQTVHLEMVVNPIECLHTLDAEELENLTRHLLLNDKERKNPMICSAHIYNEVGTGAIEMRCCELTTTGELHCTYTKEGKTLYGLHVLAIFASVVMSIALIIVWNLIDLGSEDFYFYPKDMKVKVTGETNETGQGNVAVEPKENDTLIEADKKTEIAEGTVKTVKISDHIKGLEELKETLQDSTHGKKYKVHKIKLSVNKRKCIGNDKSRTSFLRCIKEPLNDFTNCYCKSCDNTCNCCCKPCGRKCNNVKAGAVPMKVIIFLLCSFAAIAPLLPLFLHVLDTDSEDICKEYKNQDFKCPFYLENNLLPFLCFNTAIYLICTVFLRFFVCFIMPCLSEDKVVKYEKIKVTCSFMVKVIFILTLSYWIYFVIYSFIRVFVTCIRTKNKYDELIFAVLPVLCIFGEKINNVTEQYKSNVQLVLNFISKQNNELIRYSKEEHSAFIFPPNPNDNAPNEVQFRKCCRELILVINRPLVFNRSRDDKLFSKRFISQMYSKTSDCMACELNHYAVALLFAIIPCSVFVVIFFLFLNFGTTYSYSTEFTGYIAATVTFLSYFKWTHAKIRGAYMVSQTSEDWLTLENYSESWTISDIKLIPLDNQAERNDFVFIFEKEPGQQQV